MHMKGSASTSSMQHGVTFSRDDTIITSNLETKSEEDTLQPIRGNNKPLPSVIVDPQHHMHISITDSQTEKQLPTTTSISTFKANRPL